MMAEPKLTDVHHVRNRRELAAAVLAVPHDRPTRIVLERKDKPPIVYRFDYRSVGQPMSTPPFGRANWRPVEGLALDARAQMKLDRHGAIDLRLAHIARSILKAPKGLLE